MSVSNSSEVLLLLLFRLMYLCRPNVVVVGLGSEPVQQITCIVSRRTPKPAITDLLTIRSIIVLLL